MKQYHHIPCNLKGLFLLNVVLLFVLQCGSLISQDPVFSQYYIAPIHLNPAFVGVSGNGANVGLNFRMQWIGIPRAYNTFALNYDQYFESSKIGVGLRLISDSAGDGAISSNKIAGSYSYRLRIGMNGFLSGGVELGFGQQSINWDKFIFYDAIERSGGLLSPGGGFLPSLETQPPELSRIYLDINTGILYFDEKVFVGIGLAHINTPENKFLQNETNNYVGLPVRLSFQTGIQFNLRKYNKTINRSFISPNLLVIKQGPFIQINGGAFTQLNRFISGLWYRHTPSNGDALIFSFGAKYESIKLSYSFDLTISDLGISPRGAHELGLIYNFGHKDASYNINDCLMLFR